MERLDKRIAFASGCSDEIVRIAGRSVWARAVELFGFEEFSQRFKSWLRQMYLGHPVADTKIFLPGGIAVETVCVRALNDMQPSRIVGLRSVEKFARAAPAVVLKIGRFKRMNQRALGKCDLRLTTKWHVLHGDSMRRIDMCRDDERTCVMEYVVGVQYVGCCSNDSGALFNLRLGDVEVEQRVFEFSDRRIGRKYPENMKSKGGREFDAREVRESSTISRRYSSSWASSSWLMRPSVSSKERFSRPRCNDA